MHSKFSIWKMLAFGTTMLALAACSGAGFQAPTAGTQNSPFVALDPAAEVLPNEQRGANLLFIDPAKVAAQIYVSNYSSSAAAFVNDYKANNKANKKAFCMLTVGEGINAIGVDSAGELFVPQVIDLSTGQPDVLSFAPNCGAQGATLSGLKGQPAGIAFSSTGTRYVNDIVGPSSKAGNVAVFPKGSTTPSKFLTNSQIFLASGVGVDSKNNLYLSFYSPTSATGIMEFPGGKAPGKALKLANTIGSPGVPVFDSHDNMLISDDTAVTEDIYAPPYTKNPKTFPLKGHSPQCSLDKAQTTLACGDKTNTSVDIYAYPSGKYMYSFNKGLTPTVIGIAQDPR